MFGDGKGTVIHCGERECSVQRRQQKVLEEAPSPFILRNPELGERMCAAAVRLCELIQYRSAGTVEFLVDDSTAEFYFLELNSRIQVEHAVVRLEGSSVRSRTSILTLLVPQTEMVRPGLDLVGLMINLGLSHDDDSTSPFELPNQDKVARPQGHAIEARIYAEIPHLEFKPAPGLLQEVKWPEADHIRLDTWVETGTTISAFYDPMIAKLITYGADRDEAQRRLDAALQESSLLGTQTNLAYLVDVVNCDEVVSGDVTTKFLDSYAYRPNCIEVVDGGISTSVQDGRPRLPSGGDGIPRSGPADELAAKVANLLVGNPVETELLEATVSGPSLKFWSSAVVSVTGATADIYLDDTKKPMWTRFVVPAGSTLEIGACESGGNRTYISVRGGFPEIPFFAGSKSTFSAAKFGGIQASCVRRCTDASAGRLTKLVSLQGREILAGDIIALDKTAAPTDADAADFTLASECLPSYPRDWILAALPGPQADADYLLPEDRDTLYSSTFTISPASNRLGLRFDGLKPLKYSREDGGAGGSHPSNCVEHGYSTGAVNMNGDTPVLLGVDGPDCVSKR